MSSQGRSRLGVDSSGGQWRRLKVDSLGGQGSRVRVDNVGVRGCMHGVVSLGGQGSRLGANIAGGIWNKDRLALLRVGRAEWEESKCRWSYQGTCSHPNFTVNVYLVLPWKLVYGNNCCCDFDTKDYIDKYA